MPLSSDRHIIDEKFRDALDHHKVQPPGRVWTRLSSAMNETRKFRISVRYVAVVSLLIFLGGMGIWTAINEQPGKTVSISQVRSTPSEELISPSVDHRSTTIGLKSSSNDQHSTIKTEKLSEQQEKNSSTQKQSLNSFAQPVKDQATSSSHYPTDEVMFSSPELLSFTNSEASVLASLPSRDTYLPASNRASDFSMYRFPSLIDRFGGVWTPDLKGWYMGMGTAINSTWIIDRSAILSQNFKYRTTFGMAYSFHAGYNFSNKLGIEAAWVFHSTEGQRYIYQLVNTRTIDIAYNQKNISFNYMQWPVLLKLKSSRWSNITGAPVVVNYSIGAQYGRLLSSHVGSDGEQNPNANTFRKNEYALVAGIDYDFMSKKSSFLTLGARTSFGSNLYTKNAEMDMEFKHPHNFTIGLYAAFNFSLPQKLTPPTK